MDFDEALIIIKKHVKPLSAETIALSDAAFRVLAAGIVCDVDYPPFDRSVMDGYAVRAEDTRSAPVDLQVVGSIPAGATVDALVSHGQAMQINTGAPIPAGADAVVRVELTEQHGDRVTVSAPVEAGTFITPKANYTCAGSEVLACGTFLSPLNMGVAATAGAAGVSVFRRPRIAIVSTGSELIGVDRRPVGAEIRNSNEYLLVAAARESHCRVDSFGPIRDDKAHLDRVIKESLQYDAVCLTGGISMGAYDFVPEVLGSCGVTFHFRRVAIKPGRPTIFGTASNGVPVFALPGNPLSAFVGWELFVRPALALMQGRVCDPLFAGARLHGDVPSNSDRRSFRPAYRWVGADGHWSVKPLSWGGSGDSIGAAQANCMIVRAPGAPAVADGAEVSTLLLGSV